MENNKQTLFIIGLTVVAFFAIVGPSGMVVESARIKRQAPPPSNLNLTSILATLNLTAYLQNAGAPIQQAIANLTTALQSSNTALQQDIQNAIANVQNQTGNLTTSFQQFLTSLQDQLNSTGSGLSSNLTQSLTTAISTLQTFLTSNSNAAATELQQLINAIGQNITAAATNLQTQIQELSQFLQSGLGTLASLLFFPFHQSAINLQNALSSGALNQTLTAIIAQSSGETMNFQQALNALYQNANSSYQQTINSLTNGLMLFINSFTSLFGNLTTLI